MTDARSRLTRRLLPDGTEPDPRFTLANERTFLAWIRTSLALSAGGLGVEAFGSGIFDDALRKPLAVLLLLLACVLAVSAAMRWTRVERAMRRGHPLPVPGMMPILAGGVALGALATVIILVIG